MSTTENLTDAILTLITQLERLETEIRSSNETTKKMSTKIYNLTEAIDKLNNTN